MDENGNIRELWILCRRYRIVVKTQNLWGVPSDFCCQAKLRHVVEIADKRIRMNRKYKIKVAIRCRIYRGTSNCARIVGVFPTVLWFPKNANLVQPLCFQWLEKGPQLCNISIRLIQNQRGMISYQRRRITRCFHLCYKIARQYDFGTLSLCPQSPAPGSLFFLCLCDIKMT
jgi:hypothetical protein